jgi:hypothetical protein
VGKVDDGTCIARFTIFVRGFVITGFAKCKSFGENVNVNLLYMAMPFYTPYPKNSYVHFSALALHMHCVFFLTEVLVC